MKVSAGFYEVVNCLRFLIKYIFLKIISLGFKQRIIDNLKICNPEEYLINSSNTPDFRNLTR